MKPWLIAAATMALAGCVAQPIEPPPATLIGQSEVELFRAMGVPTRSTTAGGDKFDAYIVSEHWFDNEGGGPYLSYGDFWGPNRDGWGPDIERNFRCETTFEVAHGIVVGFRKHGNDC